MLGELPRGRTDLPQPTSGDQVRESASGGLLKRRFKATFDEIASHAVASEIFSTDTTKRIKSDRFPTHLLDAPYVNGPTVIQRFEEDIPQEAIDSVRRNFKDATRLLAPTEKVKGYFHEKFADNDIFDSPELPNLVDQYTGHFVTTFFGNITADAALSFKVSDVNRKAHNRNLYTEDERKEGLVFVQEHPETVLAILTYQSIMQDYFSGIRESFTEMSQQSNTITNENFGAFDKYTEQWKIENFTDELIPALSLFHKLRKDANPDLPSDQLIDQQLFQHATDFIVSNGAFRNWVNVPANVAQDGQQRTALFLCPAVSAVRDQLIDGTILEKIYTTIKENGDNIDPQILSKIREKATEKLVQSSIKPLSAEKLRAEAEERTKITITTQDTVHTIKMDEQFTDLMKDEQQEGDTVVEALPGDNFYTVLKEAVSVSLDNSSATFFDFNGRGYRITPAKITEVLNSAQTNE